MRGEIGRREQWEKEKKEGEKKKKTYRSGSSSEHGHLAGSSLKLLGGNDSLEDLGGNIPQLLVVGAEQDDDAVGLGVEGGGDMVEQVLDDLLNAGGRDGQVLGEGVVAASQLGEVDKSLGGHFEWCCGKEPVGGGGSGDGRGSS